MKIGYIITAHTLPDQLVRLVRRLESDNSRFFIHVDGRAPDEVMSVVKRELAGRADVQLVRRHRVHWASFSQLQAVLEVSARCWRGRSRSTTACSSPVRTTRCEHPPRSRR